MVVTTKASYKKGMSVDGSAVEGHGFRGYSVLTGKVTMRSILLTTRTNSSKGTMDMIILVKLPPDGG